MWLLSGPSLGPLTQPLGALLSGEHENDLKEKRVEGTRGSGQYKTLVRIEKKNPLRS